MIEGGLHYMYGTATLYQIAWTALGIVGLLITLHLLAESIGDLRALRQSSTYKQAGMRDIIARNNVRNMAMRALKLLVLVVIGVVSMLVPVSVTVPTARAALQAVGYGSIEVIIVAGAILDRRDRAALFFQIRTRRVDALLLKLEAVQRQEKTHEP